MNRVQAATRSLCLAVLALAGCRATDPHRAEIGVGPVRSVSSFLHDGEWCVLAGTLDGSVRILLASDLSVIEQGVGGGSLTDVDPYREGFVAAGAHGVVAVDRDGKARTLRHSWAHSELVTCLEVMADGVLAIGVSDDRAGEDGHSGGIYLARKVARDAPRVVPASSRIEGFDGDINRLVRVGDGLCAGTRTGTVSLWNGDVAWTTTASASAVSALAVASDILVGSRDGRLTVLDPQNGSVRWSTVQHLGPLCAICVVGTAVFTAGEEGRIARWDMSSRKVVGEASAYGSVTCMAASPDGRKLFTGHRDGSVREWPIPEVGAKPASTESRYGGPRVESR